MLVGVQLPPFRLFCYVTKGQLVTKMVTKVSQLIGVVENVYDEIATKEAKIKAIKSSWPN